MDDTLNEAVDTEGGEQQRCLRGILEVEPVRFTDGLLIPMVAFTGMEKIRGEMAMLGQNQQFCFLHGDFKISANTGIYYNLYTREYASRQLDICLEFRKEVRSRSVHL